jgi:hypothetical protein
MCNETRQRPITSFSKKKYFLEHLLTYVVYDIYPYLYLYLCLCLHTLYQHLCTFKNPSMRVQRVRSRAQGAETRSVGKQQGPARQLLGKMPYRNIPVRFQAAAGVLAAPVEPEAPAVVVTRCTGTTHKTPSHACRLLADGQPG